MRPDLLNTLFAPVSALPGVGPKTGKLFDRLLDRPAGARVLDLVFHIPHSSIDRRNRPAISQAPRDEIVTLEVRVVDHRPPSRNSKGPFRVLVEDETGDVLLVFFLANHQWIERMLPIGAKRWVSGKLELWDGHLQMVHPDKVLDEARDLAADALEAAKADITYADDTFKIVGTDRVIGLFEVAARAPEQSISAQAVFQLGPPSYPNGCHICEIELDPDTGVVQVVRHTVVDDFGVLINPMIVEGQIHGGIAQGIGLALMEDYIPGRTDNLHDYLIPTAGDVPPIETILIERPDPLGPFGAKGVGEPALIATAPAILNAIADATGTRLTQVPATPDRVLAALQAAANPAP